MKKMGGGGGKLSEAKRKVKTNAARRSKKNLKTKFSTRTGKGKLQKRETKKVVLKLERSHGTKKGCNK